MTTLFNSFPSLEIWTLSQAPTGFCAFSINDSKIVLNIAPDAVQHYEVNNENIYFSARFSGKRMELFIPIEAVLGIYGKENNQGMFFSEEQTSPPTPPSNSTKEKGKPKLMIVK